MNLEPCLLDALRAAVLLALALGAMPLLSRAPAAARRLVLALALAGALLLPAASALAPSWPVLSPAAVAPLREPFREPLSQAAVPSSPAAHPTATLALPPAPARASLRITLAQALALVWAIGALLVAARLAAGIGKARAVVRRASPAPSWAHAAACAERQAGLRCEIRTTGELDAPAVTGILSPVVLVPHGSEAWSDERRVAVLLHELSHVRRHDCLVQILAQLACAVHWFDPLAWIAARRLRVERELAADDAVIAAGARASSYAEDLLAIAGASLVPAASVPRVALGMAEPSHLAARVSALVDPSRAGRPTALSLPRAALLSAFAGALFLAVACASPAPSDGHPSAPAAAPPAPAAASSSTLDPRLQRIADEELSRTLSESQGAAGTIVVLDPATGEILANAGRDHGAPEDVAVQKAYSTGSTIKAITLAAALEEGVVTPADRFDCENGATTYGGRTLHDWAPHGVLAVPEMLAVSSNIGFAKLADRLGGDRLVRWLARFHFGTAPAIAGAAAGELPAHVADHSFEGAVLAMGQSMFVPPVQVAAAYAAIANDGLYVAPTLSRRASPVSGERLLRPETARAVVSMLEEVINGERATGKRARIEGTRVAGKTGTSELTLPGGHEGIWASFVGIVPADRPRFVVLVGVELPREGGSGGEVAAPAFARVASRALAGAATP